MQLIGFFKSLTSAIRQQMTAISKSLRIHIIYNISLTVNLVVSGNNSTRIVLFATTMHTIQPSNIRPWSIALSLYQHLFNRITHINTNSTTMTPTLPNDNDDFLKRWTQQHKCDDVPSSQLPPQHLRFKRPRSSPLSTNASSSLVETIQEILNCWQGE